jgi:hypothetical protein
MLWSNADAVWSTRLVYVEARSALARAFRDRRLPPRVLAEARRNLESLFARLDLVELLPAVVALAGDLAEAHRLRAYDAVHIASALALDDADVIVASWDGEVRRAAAGVGLDIAPAQG